MRLHHIVASSTVLALALIPSGEALAATAHAKPHHSHHRTVHARKHSARVATTTHKAATRGHVIVKPKTAPVPSTTPSTPTSTPSTPTSTPTTPPVTTPSTPVPGAVAAPSITGTAYYVSPSGSDSNSGTSPSQAWRTVARANQAHLNPGDGILFQGGATFSDTDLELWFSGTSSNPIVIGSYGQGQALITQGAWFVQNYLAFEHIAFASTLRGGSETQGKSNGIMLDDVTITLPAGNSSLGVYSWGDGWVIENSHISETGLSGMLLNGDGYLITGNAIADTGLDHTNGYNNHGIYLDASDATITNNSITGNAESAISVRYRNSVIENNVLSGGVEGIDYFQTDTSHGSSTWRGNTISGTTAADIYISDSGSGGATAESFSITGNTLSKAAGVYLNLHPTTGTLVSSPNTLN